MQGKIALEEHVAIEPTLGDSQVFGAHVWKDLSHRLVDVQDTRLGEMDRHGIELMILSLNAPAVQAIHDVKSAIKVARQANDVLAAEVRKRPDRFASFAALPMQDPEAATAELTRLLLADRNDVMAQRAAPLLAKGGAFIAVGALHLSGKRGIIEILRHEGYQVTNVW